MRSKDRLDQLLPGFEGSMRDLGSLATGRALCWALDDQRTEHLNIVYPEKSKVNKPSLPLHGLLSHSGWEVHKPILTPPLQLVLMRWHCNPGGIGNKIRRWSLAFILESFKNRPIFTSKGSKSDLPNYSQVNLLLLPHHEQSNGNLYCCRISGIIFS